MNFKLFDVTFNVTIKDTIKDIHTKDVINSLQTNTYLSRYETVQDVIVRECFMNLLYDLDEEDKALPKEFQSTYEARINSNTHVYSCIVFHIVRWNFNGLKIGSFTTFDEKLDYYNNLLQDMTQDCYRILDNVGELDHRTSSYSLKRFISYCICLLVKDARELHIRLYEL